MCIIWLASFFNEASIVLKDTDKCFKRETSFNFMSTCHTNVFKEEIKKKMDPLITSKWVYFINSWISNMNNFGCKMRKKSFGRKKQHFSVHIPIVAWNFLYINGKKRLIVPKQRGNRLRESLSIFITLARVLYYWEVTANTKLFQDSSLGNAVCSSGCRTK